MSPAAGKVNKIRHIVRIRQMLRRWRKKAALSSSSSSNRVAGGCVPPDVPVGHVAVCVGSGGRRYVVRATYLNHPVFKTLLVQAEEEYGFTNQGPLAIPCEESVFEEILRVVSGSDSGLFVNLEDFQRCCHVGLPESRPLLHGLAEKSIC